jgi:glycosyltransferase involved in cell wall biosynthesis
MTDLAQHAPARARESVPGGSRDGLVSVLIVNFNYGKFISAALDSVLRQTYRNFEVVVCDDGSTDESRAVIRRYADRHPAVVRYVFKENGGVASALNAAWAACEGDIVCLLDADDLFAPTKLQRVAQAFTTPDVGLVVNRMTKLRASGEVAGLIPQFGKLDHGWLRDKLLETGGHWSFAPASGISLRRECAERIFPIPEEEFRTEADSYLYTQAPLFCSVAAIDEPVSTLRLHTNNLTSSERISSAYARRVVNSIERMCGALEHTAVEHHWRRPSVEHNPVYAEMSFVRDYLEGRSRAVVLRDVLRAWRSSLRCRTSDRGKVLGKPVVLTFAALLPHQLGDRLLHMTYSPTRLRERIARGLLRRWDQAGAAVRTTLSG